MNAITPWAEDELGQLQHQLAPYQERVNLERMVNRAGDASKRCHVCGYQGCLYEWPAGEACFVRGVELLRDVVSDELFAATNGMERPGCRPIRDVAFFWTALGYHIDTRLRLELAGGKAAQLQSGHVVGPAQHDLLRFGGDVDAKTFARCIVAPMVRQAEGWLRGHQPQVGADMDSLKANVAQFFRGLGTYVDG
jgi:hypothetical protein